MAIKKSVQSNKFWVHYVDIKNSTNGITFVDGKKAKQTTFKTVGTALDSNTQTDESQRKLSNETKNGYDTANDVKSYSIPSVLDSSSNVGYRHPITEKQIEANEKINEYVNNIVDK